jgi:hypothetical protein
VVVPARQATEAGRPVRQPYVGVNYIPHSGTMNLATVSLLAVLEGCRTAGSHVCPCCPERCRRTHCLTCGDGVNINNGVPDTVTVHSSYSQPARQILPSSTKRGHISGRSGGRFKHIVIIRLWHGPSTMHLLCHISITFTLNKLSPLSTVRQLIVHADCFGNFLRRLAFVLASTFLYGIDVDSNLASPGMSK